MRSREPYQPSALECLAPELRHMIYGELGFPIAGKIYARPSDCKCTDEESGCTCATRRVKVAGYAFFESNTGFRNMSWLEITPESYEIEQYYRPNYIVPAVDLEHAMLYVNRFFRQELLQILFHGKVVTFAFTLTNGISFHTEWAESRYRPESEGYPEDVVEEYYVCPNYQTPTSRTFYYITSICLEPGWRRFPRVNGKDIWDISRHRQVDFCECVRDPLTGRTIEKAYLNMAESVRFLAEYCPNLVTLDVEFNPIVRGFCPHGEMIWRPNLVPRLKSVNNLMAAFRKLAEECPKLELILDHLYNTDSKGPGIVNWVSLVGLDRENRDYEVRRWVWNDIWCHTCHPAMKWIGP